MRVKVTASAKEEALMLRFINRNSNSNFCLGNTSHQTGMFRNDTTRSNEFRTDYNGSHHVQVGPCNWCGNMNHLMRNCHELAYEVTKRNCKRQHSSSSMCQPLQLNVVIEKLEHQSL